MSDGLLSTIKVMREEIAAGFTAGRAQIAELREDRAAEGAAIAAILHKLDEILAILRPPKTGRAARKKL